MNRKREISSIEPIVVQRESDWFAVSPPASGLRVGVEGATEQKAREGFRESLRAWAALADLPDRGASA